MDFIYTQIYKSPCGELIIGSYKDRICLCDWNIYERRTKIDKIIGRDFNAEFKDGLTPIISETILQLDRYFGGELCEFENIDMSIGGTIFQQLVWKELCEIGYGMTISYKDLARRLNRATSIRAVANAVGLNPISILIPCHRIIGSDGKLTGYAGGLDAKQFLIDLETSKNR